MRPVSTRPRTTVLAAERLAQRGIGPEALEAVFAYGHRHRVCGGELHSLATRDVSASLAEGLDLRPYAGLQILVDPSGQWVLTAFNAHDLSIPRNRR